MNENYYDVIKRARDMLTGEYDEIQLEEEIEKLKKEKQDLIKYLEDKIKEGKTILSNFENKILTEQMKSDCLRIKDMITIYQEILSKIKEGNYE